MLGQSSLRSQLDERRVRNSTTPPQEPEEHDHQRLCEFCTELNLNVHDFTGSRDTKVAEHRANFQKVVLPSLSFIRDQHCSFCLFLVSAVIDDIADRSKWTETSLGNLTFGLEWIKDGRQLHDLDSPSTSTRRLRIFTDDDTLADAHLVLVAPPDSHERFLGRRVDPHSIDLSRVLRWLKDCQSGHQSCHKGLNQSAVGKLHRNPSFRLIDVEQGCIVPGNDEPFLALSYVWGSSPFLRASKENIDLIARPGGLPLQDLPRAIRDAMDLTRLLGYRYIWIDSLCIIQDSPEDWKAMVTAMDTVYDLAALTICAAGGDAMFGLRGVANNSRSFRQKIVQYNKDVGLMVSHPAEHFIKRSQWDTRAWTFQERICSRRCLIFVDDRVFYQCRQSTMCEDIFMEVDPSLMEAQAWSLEMKDAVGRLFSENPLRQYTKCIQLYTQRKLTFPGDKLPAFSAVAALLSVNLSSDFQTGLPTSYFDFVLLWTPSEPMRRVHEFPSWSWSGWQYAVEYSYSTLEGVLINIHEWLTSRTWIVWYVVAPDQEEPTLVWNGEKTGAAGRWKGYASPNDFDPYGRVQVDDTGHTLRPTEPSSGEWKLTQSSTRYRRIQEPPTYLQFYTHSAFFTIDPVPPVRRSMSTLNPSLHWYSLFDMEGDWCGTVLLDQTWVANGEQVLTGEHENLWLHKMTPAKSVRITYEFIAISEARDFSTEEHDSWTYYVPSDRIDSQWDLYYVLLIVTDANGIAERRGLGKVFKDAFKRSVQPGYSWKEFMMR